MVVICFEFIIFALSITAANASVNNSVQLWFASNLLFLHYQSQRLLTNILSKRRCDLLRIYYFCTINHSQQKQKHVTNNVVICFEFIIFALSITARVDFRERSPLLWFASNLLFLHYQSQRKMWTSSKKLCCDLLRIYYFCTINHSYTLNILRSRYVVICFEFIIFALSITASVEIPKVDLRLWFASNLLFLHYQSQPSLEEKRQHEGCDLLRIYYFCTINHSLCFKTANRARVVICFEFIIFALSITAIPWTYWVRGTLWFASNLLFLHYQSQHRLYCAWKVSSCDLLRIYYFCTINHSKANAEEQARIVVICFEFIIFALSITASSWEPSVRRLLWFASNLLFLHYQSQQSLLLLLRCRSCDLLRIYYFCTINHSNLEFHLNDL